mmetsp:Transcript_11223/g.25451  ORF Transcript_11223/g.25451 Transcript_11223/m.25451 type:complete len:269 (-) Transcript_11223:879-1685(-)
MARRRSAGRLLLVVALVVFPLDRCHESAHGAGLTLLTSFALDLRAGLSDPRLRFHLPALRLPSRALVALGLSFARQLLEQVPVVPAGLLGARMQLTLDLLTDLHFLLRPFDRSLRALELAAHRPEHSDGLHRLERRLSEARPPVLVHVLEELQSFGVEPVDGFVLVGGALEDVTCCQSLGHAEGEDSSSELNLCDLGRGCLDGLADAQALVEGLARCGTGDFSRGPLGSSQPTERRVVEPLPVERLAELLLGRNVVGDVQRLVELRGL